MKRIIGIILTILLLISCKKEEEKRNPLVIEYQEKGIEYQMENKSDSAIVFYKKALGIEPTDITTIESLIKTYWWNEQPELALKILNEVPNEIKESNSILTLKGMTLEKMDNLNDAMELYKKAFKESPKIRYENEENIMEFIGYLTLQAVVGEKEKALAELKKLKGKKLTESEKQYINSIEPIIRNYKGGGYNGILGNK
ncbi:tetratricopeptide repeat protein [Polaribacter sp. M15]